VPPKSKAWALKQFGSATLYASGRQTTSVYAGPGRAFPVQLSSPGSSQPPRGWLGNAVASALVPVYYDLSGPVLTSYGSPMLLVCDFGADLLVSQGQTAVIGAGPRSRTTSTPSCRRSIRPAAV
jgi:hypothetical protein